MKTEIISGIHPVTEALKAGRRTFQELHIAGEKKISRLKSILALCEAGGIPVHTTSPKNMDKITGVKNHQGVCARTSLYPFVPLETVFQNIRSSSNPFLLLLDNISDVQNLGALIRTALCVGVTAVVIPKTRSASPTPTVSKASAGALEHISVARVTNMTTLLKELKQEGIWIAGMDGGARTSIFTADLSSPLALIIGGEEKGIRPLVKKNCDFLISIPQKGPLNSLNASAAGAVAMYEAFRQRSAI